MSDENGDDSQQASISARLGGLKVEVTGEDMEAAERTFERVWSNRLEEAGDMADALQSRLSGVQ